VDILFNFLPFVFSSASKQGRYVEGLPLRTPLADTLTTHGRVFGLLEFEYPEMFHLENVGRQVFPYFEEMYYNKPCLSVHEHLLSCVRETQTWIEKQTVEYGSVESVDFSLCIGVIWGSALYVAKCGSIGLRLYRGASFGNIFDFDKSVGTTSVVSVSGYIENGDTIVLYNSAVDGSTFPVSTKELAPLDSSLLYAHLSTFFNASLEHIESGCVVGFHITSDVVPSLEDESLVVGEVEDNSVMIRSMEGIDQSFVNRQVNLDEELESADVAAIPKKRMPDMSGISSFFSKLKNNLRFKAVLAFFTKRRVFILGCMLLLLLVGLVLNGRDFEKKYSDEQRLLEVKTTTLPKIKELYDQGLYYANLNPDRAKGYLIEAKSSLATIDSEFKKDAEIQKLSQDVDAAYSVVTKVYDLSSIQPYFDLNVLNTKISGDRMNLSGEYLVVSDSKNNVVYSVGTVNKSGAPLIGPGDLDRLVSADGDGTNVYAVSNKGIGRAKKDDVKITSMLEAQSGWGQIADVRLFSGSLYLLDTLRNQIWKYIPEGDSFSTVRNYISSETEVDLHDAARFAIDGNVWVANKAGSVMKFTLGKPDTFSLATLDEPIGSLNSIFTDSDIDYLYLLDSSSGRVIVMNKKDGTYVSTYKSSSFIGSTDITLDVKNKHLYVLTPQRIFRTDLKEEVKESD
jgi:hypothetical protein